MAKWHGKVGFSDTVEYEPGIWKPVVVERPYYGDVISNRWKRQNSGGVNDNITVSNQISIVADPYANSHCSAIVYVEFMGTNWKVSDVEVQYPRLILNIGGVYNGEQAGIAE